MSRIAVIADVHGNLPALEAVLAEIEREGFDAIVFCGDVMDGPAEQECLARLRGLGERLRWVRGNADREAGLDGPVAIRLGDVLFCHGTPDSDEGIVTVLTPPDRLAGILDGVGARLVVGGHVHHQFTQSLGYVTWVNAGSVGMPYEGAPGAYWLAIEDGAPVPRRTAYDVEAAIAALGAGDDLAGILRGEVTALEAAAEFEP